MALSELAIRRAKTMDKDHILADGDGLHLFVPPTGRKAPQNPGRFTPWCLWALMDIDWT